jgi:hypothetical protein
MQLSGPVVSRQGHLKIIQCKLDGVQENISLSHSPCQVASSGCEPQFNFTWNFNFLAAAPSSDIKNSKTPGLGTKT